MGRGKGAVVWGVLCLLLVPCVVTAETPEEAREALEHIKLEFSEGTFIKSVHEGDELAVELFLDAGMSPNIITNTGDSALISAIRGGFSEVANILIEQGADVNAVDAGGTSPLMLAVKQGDLSLIQTLIDKGANVNAKNNKGKAAISLARERNSMPVIRILLASGAVDTHPADTQSATMSW